MDRGPIAIALPADAESALAALIHGRRLAHDLGLPWMALFVDRRGDHVPELSALVEAQGGDLLHASAEDVVPALVDLARAVHAQLLVIGASRRPRVLRRLVRGTTERLIGSARPFPIVVTGRRGRR